MTPTSAPPRRGIRVASIPLEMRELPNWVGWVYVWKDGPRGKPGKWTKEPRIVRGDGRRRASSTDSATWALFRDAIAFWRDNQWLTGIGFVFTGTPFLGIDLDGMVDDAGVIDPLALRIIRQFDSYTEITPSTRGFHIIAEAEIRRGGGHNKRLDGERGIEIYDRGRFFTVTGEALTEAQVSTGRIR